MIAQAHRPSPFGEHRATLLAAVSDHGETYSPYVAARLLAMPAGLPREVGEMPPAELDRVMDELQLDFMAKTERAIQLQLEQEALHTDTEVADFESECLALDLKIRQAIRSRRRQRVAASSEDRNRLESEIDRRSGWAEHLVRGMRAKVQQMRQRYHTLEDEVIECLDDDGDIEVISLTRWRAVNRTHHAIALPKVAWPPVETRFQPGVFSLGEMRLAPRGGQQFGFVSEVPVPAAGAQEVPHKTTPEMQRLLAALPRIAPGARPPAKSVDERLLRLIGAVKALKKRNRMIEAWVHTRRRKIKSMWILSPAEKERLLAELQTVFPRGDDAIRTEAAE